MTERKVFDCDDCTKVGLKDVGHIYVAVGVFTDAAGSRDTREKYADLCLACLEKHLRRFLEKLTYDEADKWIKTLRNHS